MSDRRGKMKEARYVLVGQEVQFNTRQKPAKVTDIKKDPDTGRLTFSTAGLGERIVHPEDLVIVLDPKPTTLTEERKYR